jgi:LPS-assembly protein
LLHSFRLTAASDRLRAVWRAVPLTAVAAAVASLGVAAQPAPDAASRGPSAASAVARGAAPAVSTVPGASPAESAATPGVSAAVSGASGAASGTAPGIGLRASPALTRAPTGEAGKALPIILRAREVRGRPDLETVAEGDAELRRGNVVIRADRLSYDQVDDLARALGHVRINQGGNIYSGPEVQLRLERFEGFFQTPTYFLGRTRAGGRADRIDFIDDQRAVATNATYTSCGLDGSGAPVWVLSAGSVKLDLEANEGIARNGVLRFYGVPILAAPSLSFPLSESRKSGWLPPNIALDSKSGLQVAVPYYWNIAPNRDATLTPSVSLRRGVGLDTEVRYLEPNYKGESNLNLLPYDALARRSRYSLRMAHDGTFANDALLQLRVQRVSDDDYWREFPRDITSLTPRLLGSDLQYTRPLGDWTGYARLQGWQVLQTPDPASRIEAPYERVPQLGTRYLGRFGPGLDVALEAEFNRFVTPPNNASGPRSNGQRLHSLGSISRPYVTPGWSLIPKLSFNAASYALDDQVAGLRRNAARVIPTLSVDSAWTFERDSTWFGKAVRQTLEPRLLYVNTPYVRQDDLPNFDAAGRDFNFESIFSENLFSGVDRVSDSHQLTAGVTTRFLDPETGAESLRLGLVQRYLFRDQRITPDRLPVTQRFSDVLLLASTNLVRHWNLDASIQYRPEDRRVERSIIGVRYSPGPFRTVSATYRQTRNLTEQMEVGWQWPIYGRTPEQQARAAAGSGSCKGSLYGVGRVNYSMRDSRITDSIFGLEYDAGCWIGRIVAERLSTGRSDATTRLLLQLELVGLSRLGSNPLQVLKDNVPGYRMLREDRTEPLPLNSYD